MRPGQICLYCGLGLLAAAFIAKWTGAAACYFWILLGIAVTLKSVFLISIFKERGFKPTLWLYLILTGVAAILLSLLFKEIFPIPALHKTLFYGAITLKTAGLVLMMLSKRKQ